MGATAAALIAVAIACYQTYHNFHEISDFLKVENAITQAQQVMGKEIDRLTKDADIASNDPVEQARLLRYVRSAQENLQKLASWKDNLDAHKQEYKDKTFKELMISMGFKLGGAIAEKLTAEDLHHLFENLGHPVEWGLIGQELTIEVLLTGKEPEGSERKGDSVLISNFYKQLGLEVDQLSEGMKTDLATDLFAREVQDACSNRGDEYWTCVNGVPNKFKKYRDDNDLSPGRLDVINQLITLIDKHKKPGSEAQASSDSTNQSDGCPDINGGWHFRHDTFIFDGLIFSPPKSGSVRVIITRETGHTGVFMIGTYDCGHLELKCASSLGTEGCETVTEIISADFDPSTRTFKGSWRYHFQDNKANDRVGEFECFRQEAQPKLAEAWCGNALMDRINLGSTGDFRGRRSIRS